MWVLHAGRFTLLLHIASLIRITRGATVVANYWNTADCEGPPLSITSFNMNDTSALSPVNEKWPVKFGQVTRLYYPLGSCTEGMVPHIGARSCCITNLESDDHWSLSYDTIGASESETIPATTNGVRYCSVKSINTDLPWYNILYIQTGKCAEGFYCSPLGNLTVYNSGICNDFKSKGYQNLTITPLVTCFFIDGKGNFTVTVISFIDSTLIYGWKAYIPFPELVPEYKTEASEFLAVFFAAIAYFAIVITMNYFGRRYIRNSVNSDLLHALGQLIWLTALTINIIYIHYKSPDTLQVALMMAFSYGIKNFATFYSAAHNVVTVMEAVAIDRNIQLVCCGSLLILHVGISGSDYTFYWRTMLGESDAFIYWRKISFIWLTISELTIFLPLLLLLYKVMTKKTGGATRGPLKKQLIYIFKADLNFTRLFVTSITFLATFAVLSIIDSAFVGLYGSDRVRISFQLIRLCFQLLPFTMNCYVTQHLPEVVAILKRKKSPQRKRSISMVGESKKHYEEVPMVDLQESGTKTVKLTVGDLF
jgi:hypothetical protein